MPEKEERWDEYMERLSDEEDAAERTKKRKDRRRSLQSVTGFALAAALLGAVFSLFSLRSDQSRRERDAKEQIYARYNQEQQLAALVKRADETQRENMRLEALLEQALSGKSGPPGRIAASAQPDKDLLDNIGKSNRDLDQRMNALETAILQTPEKAVSLPLIRQQLLDMQDKDKGESDALHGEIGRLYGIMQWFLGLMITIIIGVGSMAINSFRSGTERNKPKPEESEQVPPKPAATPATTPTS